MRSTLASTTWRIRHFPQRLTRQTAAGSSSTNSYALGEEIWAYVPQNLIPQLTWLTKDPPATNGYTHVYYVDGTPRIFDVNLPSVINHTCSGLINSTTVDCSHWGRLPWFRSVSAAA